MLKGTGTRFGVARAVNDDVNCRQLEELVYIVVIEGRLGGCELGSAIMGSTFSC